MENRNSGRLKFFLIIGVVVIVLVVCFLLFFKGCKKSDNENMVILEEAPEGVINPYFRQRDIKEYEDGEYYVDDEGNIHIKKNGEEYIVRPDGSVWKVRGDGSLEKVDGDEANGILSDLLKIKGEDISLPINEEDIIRRIDGGSLSDEEIEELAKTLGVDSELLKEALKGGKGLSEALRDIEYLGESEEEKEKREAEALDKLLKDLGVSGISGEELLKRIKANGGNFEDFVNDVFKNGIGEALRKVGVDSTDISGSPIFDEIKKKGEEDNGKDEGGGLSSYDKAMEMLISGGGDSGINEILMNELKDTDSYSALNGQGEKAKFIEEKRKGTSIEEREINDHTLTRGTIINGVLLTDINTDLPGDIIGVVSENVWDTFTHSNILIPKGSKVIGSYDSSVSWGQNRVLVVWEDIERADGVIIHLNGYQGVDRSGMSGMSGMVNNHVGEIIGGGLLSTLISIGSSELGMVGSGVKYLGDVINSLGQGLGDSSSTVAEHFLSRMIDRQPTIKVKGGTRISIMSNDFIELPLYKGGVV